MRVGTSASQVRLDRVCPDRLDGLQVLLTGPLAVEQLLLALGGRAIAAFTAGSETTTNFHGCWLAPDGEDAALRSAFSINSGATGSLEK